MPVTTRTRTSKRVSLQSFAQSIERKLNAAKGPDAMANLVCRLMTGKDPKIAAHMASKWVEWRYGKATETVNVFGNQQPVMVMIGATDDRINALRQIEQPETKLLADSSMQADMLADTNASIIDSEPLQGETK